MFILALLAFLNILTTTSCDILTYRLGEKMVLNPSLIKQAQSLWKICTQCGNQSIRSGEDSLPQVQKVVCGLVLFSPSVNDLDDGTKSKLIKFTADTKLEGL